MLVDHKGTANAGTYMESIHCDGRGRIFLRHTRRKLAQVLQRLKKSQVHNEGRSSKLILCRSFACTMMPHTIPRRQKLSRPFQLDSLIVNAGSVALYSKGYSASMHKNLELCLNLTLSPFCILLLIDPFTRCYYQLPQRTPCTKHASISLAPRREHAKLTPSLN